MGYTFGKNLTKFSGLYTPYLGCGGVYYTSNKCALDGEIDVALINLTTYSNVLSFSYYPSFDFYDNQLEFTNYSIMDVSPWIWTRPAIEESVWGYNLPEYALNSTYKIHIGTIFNNTLLSFTPFEQWQSSPFLTYVIENSTGLIPNYITTPKHLLTRHNNIIIYNMILFKRDENFLRMAQTSS